MPLDIDQLIERLAKADQTPAQVAASMGVSLRQLARTVNEPDVMEDIRNVSQLAKVHVRMLVDRAKTEAVEALVSVLRIDRSLIETPVQARVLDIVRRTATELLRAGGEDPALLLPPYENDRFEQERDRRFEMEEGKAELKRLKKRERQEKRTRDRDWLSTLNAQAMRDGLPELKDLEKLLAMAGAIDGQDEEEEEDDADDEVEDGDEGDEDEDDDEEDGDGRDEEDEDAVDDDDDEEDTDEEDTIASTDPGQSLIAAIENSRNEDLKNRPP